MEEISELVKKTREDNYPSRTRVESMNEPRSLEFIMGEITKANERSPNNYHSTETFAKPGTNVDPVAAEVYTAMMIGSNPNIIDPQMFQGGYELEREALAQIAGILGKDEDDETLSDGFFLSGGTESIMQALWTFRNKFFTDRGINVDELGVDGAMQELRRYNPLSLKPTILAPIDSHFALDKVVRVLGLGKESILYYNMDENFETDYEDFERVARHAYRIGRVPFANFCVAGDTQKGRVQNVEKIVDILNDVAEQYEEDAPPTVVDAAAQYLFLAVMKDSEKYEGSVPVWDFRNPEVRAIIADPHKNEIPYNTGVILMRDQLTDGRYTESNASYLSISKENLAQSTELKEKEREAASHSITLPTSRGGYGAAATWAYNLFHGVEGIREKKEAVWEIVSYLRDEINKSPLYELSAEPQTANVPIHLANEPSAERHKAIELAINGNPDDDIYIAESDSLRARTREDLTRIARGDESFSGLYLHVMECNTLASAQKLVQRLNEEASKL